MSAAHPAEAAAGTPGPEPLDARRRRELIEATITSIARHGLSRTTVARVAKIAGLSPGIVSFYFKNKDGLLLATLAHVDGEFTGRQIEGLEHAGSDPVRQLEAMIEASFDPAVCNPERVAVWTAFWGEARAREDYMRVCDRREADDARRVVDLFERIAANGSYHHLDAVALGRAFYQLLSSLPEDMLDARQAFDFEAAKSTCRGFLASVFPAEFSPRARAAEPAGSSPRSDYALPARVYHDPALFELERERIFMRHWLLVGHASEVPDPGDHLTLDVADERAFVIRDDEGTLRAFHNLCPHRGARLVRSDSGRYQEAIVCPFHGWRFDFTGALQTPPGTCPAPPRNGSGLRLPEIALSEWCGFLFVRFEGAGPEVAEAFRPYDDEVRPYGLAQMRPCGPRRTHRLESNWKVFAENAAEARFVPPAHPALQGLLGPELEADGVGDVGRSFGLLGEAASASWSARLYQRWLPEVSHLPRSHRRSWLRYSLFPGTVLTLRPDGVEALQVLPLGPERCRIQGFALAREDERREMRAVRYLSRRIDRAVAQEERRLCRDAHQGMRSSRFEPSPLSHLEPGRRRIQQRIRELVPIPSRPEARAEPRGANEALRASD